MKLVRRVFLFVGTLSILGLLLFGQLTAIKAQNEICEPGSPTANSTFCMESNNPDDLISGEDNIFSKVISFITTMVAFVAVFVIVVGGFRIVVSNGDSQSVSGARNMIIYGVVGLTVAMLAKAIVALVLNRI